jgi:hypothetical protein
MGCEGAFPIGDEILLHWVSAGTKGKEVLLYLALLALLWAPWSLLQDDEDVCKLCSNKSVLFPVLDVMNSSLSLTSKV